MKFKKIEGLIAAPYTPMKEDGSVNPEAIPLYARKMLEDKLQGVFICGSTGEGMSMTNEERMRVVEEWVRYQRDDFRIFVHVGSTSAKQSHELAKHAREAGAYAIASIGPMFLKPVSLNELVEFCAEIASGAPDLPFYYYHFPALSGVNFAMNEFLRLAEDKIPNLAGIKFTHNNFMDMMQCLEMDGGKWDILNGYDEVLIAGLASGAKGAVGSTYNYMAGVYSQLMDAFQKGDLEAARKKQAISIRVIEILCKYGGPIAAGKALMKAAGVDCGPCRLPVKNVTGDSYTRFIKEIAQTGILSPVKQGRV